MCVELYHWQHNSCGTLAVGAPTTNGKFVVVLCLDIALCVCMKTELYHSCGCGTAAVGTTTTGSLLWSQQLLPLTSITSSGVSHNSQQARKFGGVKSSLWRVDWPIRLKHLKPQRRISRSRWKEVVMPENFCLRWNDHHDIFFSSAEKLCHRFSF